MPGKRKIWQAVLTYIKIVLGAVVFAFGFRYFTYENSIVSGGVAGIAMIVNYLTRLPVGAVIIAINAPLFLIAWRQMGIGFMISSMVGMAVSSAAIDVFGIIPLHITSEPMLAAVYGGVIMGLGLGTVYSAGATTGGADIVGKLIRRKRAHLNLGTILLGIDVAVIIAFAVIFRRYDSSMYAMITMFIVSKVVDLVLYGLSISKVCYIISDKSERLKRAIVEELKRGVTLLKGVGAYSGQDKQVILCVIKQQQIVDLRRAVHSIDPCAFVIVSEARDVFGEGFEDIGSNK